MAGAEHCVDLHSKILHKTPTLDFVQSLAINPRAFEPGHAISLEEIHEVRARSRSSPSALRVDVAYTHSACHCH